MGSYIKYVKQMLRLKLIFDEVMGAQVGGRLGFDDLSASRHELFSTIF